MSVLRQPNCVESDLNPNRFVKYIHQRIPTATNSTYTQIFQFSNIKNLAIMKAALILEGHASFLGHPVKISRERADS